MHPARRSTRVYLWLPVSYLWLLVRWFIFGFCVFSCLCQCLDTKRIMFLFCLERLVTKMKTERRLLLCSAWSGVELRIISLTPYLCASVVPLLLSLCHRLQRIVNIHKPDRISIKALWKTTGQQALLKLTTIFVGMLTSLSAATWCTYDSKRWYGICIIIAQICGEWQGVSQELLCVWNYTIYCLASSQQNISYVQFKGNSRHFWPRLLCCTINILLLTYLLTFLHMRHPRSWCRQAVGQLWETARFPYRSITRMEQSANCCQRHAVAAVFPSAFEDITVPVVIPLLTVIPVLSQHFSHWLCIVPVQ